MPFLGDEHSTDKLLKVITAIIAFMGRYYHRTPQAAHRRLALSGVADVIIVNWNSRADTLACVGAVSKQLADVEEATQQLQQAVATVDALYADFPKLNKALADAGAPYFGIDLNAVPAPTGGRGGGQL